jgi:hypothetical protein
MFEQQVADPAFSAVHGRLFGLAYRMLGHGLKRRTLFRMSTSMAPVRPRRHRESRGMVGSGDDSAVHRSTTETEDRAGDLSGPLATGTADAR